MSATGSADAASAAASATAGAGGQTPWPNLAEAGSEPAPDGSELAKAGSNWRALADFGRPENEQRPEKLIPISDLLEKPIFPAEKAWVATREDASQRPFWLNGVSAAALESGQNCPPSPPPGVEALPERAYDRA